MRRVLCRLFRHPHRARTDAQGVTRGRCHCGYVSYSTWSFRS